MRKLDCQELRLLLDAFEDNELDGVTSLSVQEHLDACAACRAHRFWHAETHAALRRLRAATPGAPAVLREQVRNRLIARRSARWWPAAAAALTMVAGVTVWQALSAGAAEPMEFVRNHMASIEKPDHVELATADAAAAEAWLRKRLSFPFHVPRRPPAGFHLAGARLCSVARHKVAYLLYEQDDAKRPVSLFIGPPGACNPDGLTPVSAAGIALRRGDCDGTSVAAWETGGVSYVLAGDVSTPALLAYAAQEVAR